MNQFSSLYFCNHFKRWKVEVWIGDKRVSMNYSRYLMCHKVGRWLETNEYVHHRDGDKLNDLITNLEIIRDYDHTKLHNSGVGNPAAKLTRKQVLRIRYLYSKNFTQRYLAYKFNCSEASVHRIVHNQLWRGLK